MRALGRFLALALLPPLLFVAPGRRATGVPGGCRGRSLARHVQRNPYDVLGLSSGCSYDDIRAAFRKLARTYHPDVPDTGDEDRFRSIGEALEELGTPAGRARWSGGGAHAHAASRASYSSYTSDFQGYGYGSYGYETRGDPYGQRAQRDDRKRRQETERERREQNEREWRRENRRKKEDAKKYAKKKAQGAEAQDAIMERELKKAVKEAEERQARRKKMWWKGVKEARESLKRDVQQEMTTAWNAVHRFQDNQKQLGRQQAEKWKAKLEATRHASANQRKEDGEIWVQKFTEVKQEAAARREELGRRFAEKWREFRAENGQVEQRQVVSPEKINEEIEELLRRQDERISERWSELYKDMMKSVQRSMNNEPKHWKDRFRAAMIQLGRGGEHVQRRWMALFQDTMKDMGEQEMNKVSQWVSDFKTKPPWSDKELAKRAKLVEVSGRLKPLDLHSQQRILKTIDQCHKAEIQRLKWKAWNRGQWVKKFRQEQDRLWKSQQEEELRMTDEFWKAVKEGQL